MSGPVNQSPVQAAMAYEREQWQGEREVEEVEAPRPSLVQRQDALVAQLQPVHHFFIKLGHGAGGAYAGHRARIKHGHIKEMMAAGYSASEAAESAKQCDDVARLNADHDVLNEQLGAQA